ncbi:MAG: recombinase family protein [Oscillospiraceae bacterium]|jgi:DNA invertase Pin-like site-specific DNA recombinase|nr:recombinase family protein [Oscillospiraceae bacterium]
MENKNQAAKHQKVAVGYYRTAASDDGGDMLRQTEAAKEKAGILSARIDAAYADRDGMKDGEIERPGFTLLSKFLSEVKVDYVIMRNQDHLSDNKQEAAEMMQAIEQTGARVEFVGMHRQPNRA